MPRPCPREVVTAWCPTGPHDAITLLLTTPVSMTFYICWWRTTGGRQRQARSPPPGLPLPGLWVQNVVSSGPHDRPQLFRCNPSSQSLREHGRLHRLIQRQFDLPASLAEHDPPFLSSALASPLASASSRLLSRTQLFRSQHPSAWQCGERRRNPLPSSLCLPASSNTPVTRRRRRPPVTSTTRITVYTWNTGAQARYLPA
jgi:hypothetical protein